ncbi:MAG TPA: MXAN_5187 C-terminal domain-containing protein, partial [Usitatibacter sp.]|nr:MXAN_5187 C-terminal domain-containing protein [Usitatibacter sp.]
MPEQTETERDLQRLEAELKRLEAEYNMYFSGRLPKPPWETRARVESIVKKFDRAYIQNYGDRFRFTTLQTRYATFIDLWDRGLRAREEGRAGPFALPRPKTAEKKGPEDRILHVAAFHDPVREIDKLTDLYESLAEARREVGEEPVPFHRFAELVKNQVKKLRDTGGAEVAFRVAVKEGKVNFTARVLKGVKD